MGKVLVTGGAGFIGSHAVDSLLAKGYSVKVLDDLSTGKEENLSQAKEKIEFIKGSILDAHLLERELKGFDAVVHFAALRSVFESIKRPNDYNEVNVNGTVNVLEAMRKNKVKRMVFASSSSIYGASTKIPQTESDAPQSICPYALTKLFGEYYLKLYNQLFGMETVSLRFFNVYGPRQDPSSQYACVIPIFTKAILKGEQPTIFGDGQQSRDFTYVKDIAASCLAALEAPAEKVAGETLNIANSNSIKVIELVEKINAILGKGVEPKFAPAREGEANKTQGNPEKAKKLMGFSCKVLFDEGLKKTVEWFKEKG